MEESVSSFGERLAKTIPLKVQQFLAITASVAGIFNALFDENSVRRIFVLSITLLVVAFIVSLNWKTIKKKYRYEIKYRSGRSSWNLVAFAILAYFLAIVLSSIPSISESIHQRWMPVKLAFDNMFLLSSGEPPPEHYLQSIATLIFILFGIAFIQAIIIVNNSVTSAVAYDRGRRCSDLLDKYITITIKKNWSIFLEWFQQQSWDTLPEYQDNKRKEFSAGMESVISVATDLEISEFSNGVIKMYVLSEKAFDVVDDNKKILEASLDQYIKDEILDIKGSIDSSFLLIKKLDFVTFD